MRPFLADERSRGQTKKQKNRQDTKNELLNFHSKKPPLPYLFRLRHHSNHLAPQGQGRQRQRNAQLESIFEADASLLRRHATLTLTLHTHVVYSIDLSLLVL